MFLACMAIIERPVAEERKNAYVTIQTTSKHLASSLNSRQAVHKRYRAASHCRVECTRLAKKVKPPSRVAIYLIRVDFRCLAVDSVVALWLYERFNFNESYFTIHPFFAPISYLAIFVD